MQKAKIEGQTVTLGIKHFRQLLEFKRAVKEMRDYQKQYFKTRNMDFLKEAKKSENRVDQLIVEIEAPSLF